MLPAKYMIINPDGRLCWSGYESAEAQYDHEYDFRFVCGSAGPV